MTATVEVDITSAEAMRDLGRRLGAAAQGGDVIVLTGDLGAGKTTLTQGIALGMGITEQITSPTFVIARVHQHPGGGPDLVHVDAYRLDSLAEVDDLDLDSDLDRSVVVVEWGEGRVDFLSASRVDVIIARGDDDVEEARRVAISAQTDWWPRVAEHLAPGLGGA
jgi:tRNA threonylcarbamoyladenosine biosynthesis protein TsaE